MKQTFETDAQRRDRLAQWHPFFAILPREVAPGERRYLERIERRITWVSSPSKFPFQIRGKDVIEFRAIGAPDREVPDPYKWFRDVPDHKPPAPKPKSEWKSDEFIDGFQKVLRDLLVKSDESDVANDFEKKLTIFHSRASDRWFLIIGDSSGTARAFDSPNFVDLVKNAAKD